MDYVKKHGEGNWNAVQRNSGLMRCGKSCRLRWANHLRPHLKKGAFTPEEERIIIDLHAKLGNKWARMAAQVKSHFYFSLSFHSCRKNKIIGVLTSMSFLHIYRILLFLFSSL